MAVVKADGYGHGGCQIAEAALEAGATRLAVAYWEEGRKLRDYGITAPVLVMGYIPRGQLGSALDCELTPVIWTKEQVSSLHELARGRKQTVRVHLKVDTGMGRLGVLFDRTEGLLSFLLAQEGLELEGFYTHLSVADSGCLEDRQYTNMQVRRFMELVSKLQNRYVDPPLLHVANSAALVHYGERCLLDCVRPGIAIYGLSPDSEPAKRHGLKPALALKARVAHVKTLPPDFGVSYGRTYTTTEPTRVAVIPVGYADGYDRALSNSGEVLIGGQRQPIIGRVCMDQFMVRLDVRQVVKAGDTAVLIGRQGEEEITAEEVAGWLETIHYEVVSRLGTRLPRVYL